MDNAEGFILGAKVGQDVLKKVGKIKVTDNTVPNLTGNLNGELKEKVEIGSVVQSSDEIGHLYSASNPSITDKKILFISKQDKNTVKPSDGWTLEEVGVDSYWQKGAYGLLPTTIISNRYIVTIVGTYSPETSTSKTELVYYDLKTGQFNNFFKNGEQQDIQSSIDKVSDDTFGYFYYPPNSFNLDTNTLKDKFIYRREVSLPNLAFKDYKIAIPQEFFQSQNSNFGLQEIGGKKYLYKQNYNQNTGLPTDTIYSKFNNNMFEKPVTIPDSNNAENIILGGQDVFLVKNLDLDKGEVSIFQKDKLFLSYPLIKNNLSGRIMAEDDDNIFVEIIPKLQASFRGTQIQVINKKTKEITGILKNDYKIVADNNPDSDPNSYVVAFDVAGVGIYK